MKQLKKYLFKTYAQTFFPIFFVLFIITSVVFLIKIALLTSVIKISFLELLLLFSFNLPKILFYILPVTIFISIALSISKISNDYELMVINSFGLNPLKVIKIFIPHLFVTTFLLLIISLVLVLKANYLNFEFLDTKKSEAQFNINPSEFGQKFGNWFIYVNDKIDNTYKDIVLFKKDEKAISLVISNEANTHTASNNNLSLNLTNGKSFYITDSIKQINFDTMTINNEIKTTELINTFDDVMSFWKNMFTVPQVKAEFIYVVLYSFFPLLSALFILCVATHNPRYDKNRTTALSLLLTIVYLVFTHKISKSYGLEFLFIFPSLWVFASYFYYLKKVKNYY